MFQARFENGIYRDCPFCRGKGCMACPGEADKEYKRQFPDGPMPEGFAGTSGPALVALIGPMIEPPVDVPAVKA